MIPTYTGVLGGVISKYIPDIDDFTLYKGCDNIQYVTLTPYWDFLYNYSVIFNKVIWSVNVYISGPYVKTI